MNQKVKHLEMIQNVITRMANYSFITKIWTLTLFSVSLLFIAKDLGSFHLTIIALGVVIFWFLDSYYLFQQRVYQDLFGQVRLKEESEINFDMNVTPFEEEPRNWLVYIAFDPSRWVFYAILLGVLYLIAKANS